VLSVAWIYLIIGGLLEPCWAISLARSNRLRNIPWTVATAVFVVGSLYLLSLSMLTLPAGTAYAVWTGIGAVGTLLVVIGLALVFSIITALLKVLPFLANIVGAGIGLVCVLFGVAWSLLVISVSWLFYRPLIGVPMVIAAVALIWLLKKKAAAKKAAAPAQEAAATPAN